ncbi:ABC transporter permease subunit [Klebsiella pneumoniae subsp. pneumoniae]|nr:ABC transporter permease subunit [Klebsiella pneumoniae subsp. pneumoniae]
MIIAIPLGGILAFLMVRTDLPGRRIIEPLILVPIFVSPMVLGFGYVVAAGPVGLLFPVGAAADRLCAVEYLLMFSIVVIAGLTHVPHAYLYISSALRSVGSDVEEAARTVGATPLQVMTSVRSADGAAIHSLRLRVALFPRSGSLRSDAGAGRPRGAKHGCWRPISTS